MNEYIDSRELQQMKEQLAILTQKLDKETIVNERLMRRAMKEKVTKMQNPTDKPNTPGANHIK